MEKYLHYVVTVQAPLWIAVLLVLFLLLVIHVVDRRGRKDRATLRAWQDAHNKLSESYTATNTQMLNSRRELEPLRLQVERGESELYRSRSEYAVLKAKHDDLLRLIGQGVAVAGSAGMAAAHARKASEVPSNTGLYTRPRTRGAS